ncbi:MAG TPA: DNA-3-methyladenine glycosylase 2 family protein [Acidimicrobiia bacterium]|nr:DNA-3-methyladenine glycosylase 2 family protein [Acidimicrobiia bacterium]
MSVPVTGPLDLRQTLRPLHGWFADDGWWLTSRTPDGPGTIRIRRTPQEVVGEAWGRGASWLLDSLGAIAGLEDDPSGFTTDHPLVGDLHRRHPGLRFGRTGLVFDALVAAIAGQKVTGSEASSAMRGLRRAFGEAAPGPREGLLLPPDPERMAAAPYWAYHDLHLEKRRADLLRRVAADFAAIEAANRQPPAVAALVLARHRGVGPWTVAKTLVVSHGDPDQVEVGDFHTKHIVVHHLTGRDRGTDEEMLELLEPFRPQRGRVIRLLHALGHEPKFGPRMSPRDITAL